jgi:hypothetical protein
LNGRFGRDSSLLCGPHHRNHQTVRYRAWLRSPSTPLGRRAHLQMDDPVAPARAGLRGAHRPLPGHDPCRPRKYPPQTHRSPIDVLKRTLKALDRLPYRGSPNARWCGKRPHLIDGNAGAFNFIDGLAVDNPTAAANGFGQNQLWLPLITNFSGVGIQEGTSAISPGSASIWQTDSRAACPC